MALEKVLVVDDELLVRNFLVETLTRKKFDVTAAESGEAALPHLKAESFDLVITDMKMPGMTGIDVLKKVKELSPNTLVVVVTAFGSIENAVDAMKLGAFNYLIKPFSPDTIEAVLEKAQEHLSLVEENQYLRQQVSKGQGSRSVGKIIGESAVMRRILEDAQRVAKSNASVFINGESGTGKEVISHAIHFNSLRHNRPYIRVNCAAIPETLIESEFFGHEKGAFTGAHNRRIGRFELANGGSLLLDEVTEIPMGLQAKLLRVIQEQELERVGGSKLIRVDARLISTSNRNMKEAIDEKVFREDLYYRLNVVPIHLPPLRDRREDILPLAEYFLERLCIENHKRAKRLSPEAQRKILNYPWPGNIRELANIIERAVVMDYSAEIAAEHLVLEAYDHKIPAPAQTPVSPTTLEEKNTEQEAKVSSSQLEEEDITVHEMEKRLILKTLAKQGHNRTKAAEALGISIRTLRNKLNEYKASGSEVG